MPETSAGLAAVEPLPARRRSRGPEDGRLVTNVPACFGAYIVEQSEDLGVSPATIVRMLLVEALKGRGFTKADLEARYPNAGKVAPDKRVHSSKP